ncbi:hypothetical protein [Streptomyces sp. ME19-01-6]|uniref:hypothetical protein n=1 Tax=Streptomyces sp. ME19-01-6 TaxID=3028686 RepID=UPI0029A2D607|nr:hypothetical protein [Streptomyces sp. ME19-01-6]MDX3224381.1 hypothetical protein [Streptomyces sp. ME19-01-6]
MSALYAPTARPARTARTARAGRPDAGFSHRRDRRGRRIRVEWVLLASGAALVPWLVVLATTLPPSTRVGHWNAAWVGLDALEALGLLATGLLRRRGDDRHRLTAAATCALLVVDAWFDSVTAAPGAELAAALAMAVGAELPLAAVCAVLALKRTPGTHRTGPDAHLTAGTWPTTG